LEQSETNNLYAHISLLDMEIVQVIVWFSKIKIEQCIRN